MSISPDGRLIALATALVGLASLSVVAQSLWPATALAALMLGVATTADAWLLVRSPRLVLQRHAPLRFALGRAAEIELELQNPASASVEADLEDELPRDLLGRDPQFAGVQVPGQGSTSLRYSVVPQRRGVRELGVAVALVRSPFGLLRRRVLSEPAASVQVFPDASRFLRPEALDTRRVLALLGVKPAARRGDGMDFDSLRGYVPGDDPRRVDWRASGRRGRLITRQYRNEDSRRLVIAIDSSRLMGAQGEATEAGPGRSKLDHCIDASLALAYAGLHSGDRVGLVVFDRGIHARVAAQSRRAALGLFVDALGPVQSRLVEADYRALVRGLFALGGGRSLFVILSDFAGAPVAEVQGPLALLARRHRVLLVAVRDPVFREGSSEHSGSGPRDLYRQLVLDDLLREREETLAQLRRSGVQTLDLGHGEITAPVLNRYLALRER